MQALFHATSIHPAAYTLQLFQKPRQYRFLVQTLLCINSRRLTQALAQRQP